MTAVLVKRRCRSRRRQGQQSRHRVSERRDQHDKLSPHPVLPLPGPCNAKQKLKPETKSSQFVLAGREQSHQGHSLCLHGIQSLLVAQKKCSLATQGGEKKNKPTKAV